MATQDLERRGGTSRGNPYPPTHYSPLYFVRYRFVYVRRGLWTAWLVPMIVVANMVMFFVTMFVNNCPGIFRIDGREDRCVAKFLGRLSFQPVWENPFFGPSSSTLEKLGALEWNKVVHEHQGWRLVSCIWLHAGVTHLLMNMLILVILGIPLEQQFGFVQVGAIYLLSGFGGSILSSHFIQGSIAVGASGALFGLLGAMSSELLTHWNIHPNNAAVLSTFVLISVLNLAVGIIAAVDNFAHIGGFMTGFLLGIVLLLRPQFGWMERRNLPADARVESKFTVYQYVLLMVALVLLIVGFTVGTVMLFKGENGYKHCSWCHYRRCTSSFNCRI